MTLNFLVNKHKMEETFKIKKRLLLKNHRKIYIGEYLFLSG